MFWISTGNFIGLDVHKNSTNITIAEELYRYGDLTEQVIRQAGCRAFACEKLPLAEKIISIFEPHIDNIVKGNRVSFFGQKICLTGNKSNLKFDCLITKGNPAGSTLTLTMLDRKQQLYGRYPLKAAMDGCLLPRTIFKTPKQTVSRTCALLKNAVLKSPIYDAVRIYKIACGGFAPASNKAFRGSNATSVCGDVPERALTQSEPGSGLQISRPTLFTLSRWPASGQNG